MRVCTLVTCLSVIFSTERNPWAFREARAAAGTGSPCRAMWPCYCHIRLQLGCLMPTAVATQTPLEDSPILAVLPSFLSSSIHNPRQTAPAPPTPTGPDSPVDVPITVSSDPSFSRSYTSDEAWLRAQTDSCRLDAMWMASDLNTIQDLVQDQEEHLSPASPLTSMPPSGLIRSICFVGEHMCSAFWNPRVVWTSCQYDISCSQQVTLYRGACLL